MIHDFYRTLRTGYEESCERPTFSVFSTDPFPCLPYDAFELCSATLTQIIRGSHTHGSGAGCLSLDCSTSKPTKLFLYGKAEEIGKSLIVQDPLKRDFRSSFILFLGQSERLSLSSAALALEQTVRATRAQESPWSRKCDTRGSMLREVRLSVTTCF